MRRNALVGILLVVMFVSIIGMFGTAGASGGEGQNPARNAVNKQTNSSIPYVKTALSER